MYRLTICLAFVLALALAAPVSADTLGDNFNDNSIGDEWDKTTNKIKLKEKNKKLRFKSADSGGGERASFLSADGWTFNFTKSYTIDIKYRMRVNDSEFTGTNKWAALGFGLELPGETTISVFVRKDADGLWAVFEVDDDGLIVLFEEVPITKDQAALKVKYSKSADRLRVWVDGELELQIDDLLAGASFPSVQGHLDLGAVRKGFVQWGFNQVWIDNFEISGSLN